MHDEGLTLREVLSNNNTKMERYRSASPAVKVGVFYDGSYFTHVSNYYNYVHSHRRRLHIGGLHEFVKHMVADKEGVTPNLCHIIDAHFFRGRFSAREANEKPNQLYYDRVFDDVLMYNGVQTHYLPVKDMQGRKREKGTERHQDATPHRDDSMARVKPLRAKPMPGRSEKPPVVWAWRS